MRLELPKGDLEAAAANDHLAMTSVHDAKGTERLGELCLVARARMFGRRPLHLGERDPNRVRGPLDRQTWLDRSL
jgi:hypothetical protein